MPGARSEGIGARPTISWDEETVGRALVVTVKAVRIMEVMKRIVVIGCSCGKVKKKRVVLAVLMRQLRGSSDEGDVDGRSSSSYLYCRWHKQ